MCLCYYKYYIILKINTIENTDNIKSYILNINIGAVDAGAIDNVIEYT
jgi:hypothetical protein